MNDYCDHHLTIFLPSSVAGPIETIRRAWDPAMAAQIAAHVTLAYPQEAPDPALLLSRLRSAATATSPFRLQFGAMSFFGRPEDGVYIAVEDCDGGFKRLRGLLLGPPFEAVAFQPHVTLVHPRTSSRGRECWDDQSFEPPLGVFTVVDVAMTAFDGTTWATLSTIRLGGQVDENSSG
jgi:2'-5' RNA ligase